MLVKVALSKVEAQGMCKPAVKQKNAVKSFSGTLFKEGKERGEEEEW